MKNIKISLSHGLRLPCQIISNMAKCGTLHILLPKATLFGALFAIRFLTQILLLMYF